MARLTHDEWAEMRREWEASPRQGLTWLLKSAGGRWDITEEPIRKRRAAEGWAKPVNMGDVVRRAHAAADQHSAHRLTEDPEPPVPEDDAAAPVGGFQSKTANPSPKALPPGPGAEGIAVDLRTELLERHRKEWGAVRRLFYRSMQEAESATGFDLAKFAKISAETASIIHRGEAQAWGLDSLLIDFDAMDEAQLEAIVKHGRLPR